MRTVVVICCLLSTMAFAAPVKPSRIEMRKAGARSVPRLVEATIVRANHNKGTNPNSSSQLNAYTVGCGREIDQAGHAIPKVLGGSGAKENIYPLNKQLNNRLGRWEKKLGDMLKTGKCASFDYRVELVFGDDKLELRPTKVTIRAVCTTPDGKVSSMGYAINNTKPKACEVKTYPDK
jgi:hypothetical protein